MPIIWHRVAQRVFVVLSLIYLRLNARPKNLMRQLKGNLPITLLEAEVKAPCLPTRGLIIFHGNIFPTFYGYPTF